MSFLDETRRHLATANAELDASLPLLKRLDIRGNNCVPRLFVTVPLSIKNALTDREGWLRSGFQTSYRLYFVCIHSLKAIEPPLPIPGLKCCARSCYEPVPSTAWHGGGARIDLGFVEAGVILK
jgi:hypothetical protein